MPGFYTGGGGATASDVWNYPVRTLTQYKRTADIIKNKDYANATPDDIIYSTVAYASGLVTLDELASFIDYGVANLTGIADVYANIIQLNPLNFWLEDVVALILDNVNMRAGSGARILASARIAVDKVASILNSPNISVGKSASIINDANLTADRAASILNSTNISVGKSASIINDANLALPKAASILMSAMLEVDRVASIISHPNATADRVASIFNDPNFTTSRAASVLNSVNTSIDKATDILASANISISKVRSILADPAISAGRVQAILYAMVDKGYFDRLLQLMTFDAPDASVTVSTTLTTGVNRYRMLSIASGATLTLGASPGVIIADTVTNGGTIASGWWRGAGGAPGAPGAGAGGRGAGGIIILARSITIGTITANGERGGDGSTVAFYGSGGAGGGGLFWVVSPDTPPNGGDGGGYYYGRGRSNGGGGGGGYVVEEPDTGYIHVYAGGHGGSASVTSFASAVALLTELFKAIIDWWIANVLGKTPSTVRAIPSLGGSGGGGGAAVFGVAASGGGGGGGGQIIVFGISVTAGTLRARGGAGGNGGTSGFLDSGGGGGGGGIIYVFYRSLTGTNTFDVAGGAGGVGKYNGSAGGNGIGRGIPV
jgi:hypothetical protein